VEGPQRSMFMPPFSAFTREIRVGREAEHRKLSFVT
jgi:hypothetical protein